MKLGLDFHGVLDENPLFIRMATDHVRRGDEVHIITGEEDTPKFREKLEAMGVRYTHLFSISSYHISIGTKVWYKDSENPFMDERIWNRTKAEYCERMRIDYHIDDSEKYLQYFTTPYLLYRGRKSC